MTAFFRPLAILVELIILVTLMYTLFMGMNLGLSDLGLDRRHVRFLKIMAVLISCLILFFFVSHLITFYPRLMTVPATNG